MAKKLSTGLFLLFLFTGFIPAFDQMPGRWANWRGPNQMGTSDETLLPTRWSPQGENLVWKVPVGGRSAPILMGDRLYLVNTYGTGALEQEQVLCLDANTGKEIWHHRFNLFGSDVPPHRVGWASPVGDPATERIYVLGVGGMFFCLDRNGKVLWQHSMAEEFGFITTHGGRTNTPIIFEDMVIFSGLCSGWGSEGRGGHRYFAFDKNTGVLIWMSQPGGAPYDTTYTTPVIASIGGRKVLLDGGADGSVYAMKPRTGEALWRYVFSKRGINTCVVTDGKLLFATQGEENIETSTMGAVVALDPTRTGVLTKEAEKWKTLGLTIGYSSPVLAGNRIYAIDNGSNLFGIDAETGQELWKLTLGTIQKASPVYADGKLYVGTENGKFYILKPGDKECEILDSDELSAIAGDEAILASVAVSRGRVYLVSMKNTYCIGSRNAGPAPKSQAAAPAPPASGGTPAYLQVVPAEVLLNVGQEAQFRIRSFDADGNFVREEPGAWSLSGIQGNVSAGGLFSASTGPQAGLIVAKVGDLKGTARIRVFPSLPYEETFDSLAPNSVPTYWIGAPGKFQVREVGGQKVLVKLTNPQSMLYRGRAYFGPPHFSNYTVEADVLGFEKRRQMPDIGVIAQGYSLVLAGNAQKLHLESWTPEVKRTQSMDFAWKPEIWYRVKVRTEIRPDGTARILGKVWPRGETEPPDWTITREDPIPVRNGSPGLYFSALNEIYIDNIKVSENSK